MSDYVRCKDHNMLRCPMCAPVTAHFAKVPAGAHVAAGAWSPEDALDQSMGASSAKPTTVQQAPVVDKQLQEAIERRKSMQAAAPVDVNFGAVPAGVKIVVEPIPDAPLSNEFQPGRAATVQTHVVSETEDVFKPTSGDPIVVAAAAYSRASTEMKVVEKKLEILKIDLEHTRLTYNALSLDVEAKRVELAKVAGLPTEEAEDPRLEA